MGTLQNYTHDISAGASLITQNLVKAELGPDTKALVSDHKFFPLQTSSTVASLGEGTTEIETGDPPKSENLQLNTEACNSLYADMLIYAH